MRDEAEHKSHSEAVRFGARRCGDAEGVTIATSADGTKIAWEERGEGRPLLLVQGLGYAGSWGWGPVLEPLARTLPRDLVRQPWDRRQRPPGRPVLAPA